MLMTLDRSLQTQTSLDSEPMRALPGLELPGPRRVDSAAVHHHIVAWPEFVEVWLAKALQANASGVIPILASQLFTAHLAQLGRALGATRLALGPLHSAPAVAVARAIAPGLTVLPRALLEPDHTVDVTGDLLDLTQRADCPSRYVQGPVDARRLLFHEGAPVWFAGAPCTLGAVLNHLGVVVGFEALVDSKRRLEARCLSAESLYRKRALEAEWSRLVANGGWFHPHRRELDHTLRDIGRQVRGEVTLTPVVAAGGSEAAYQPALDDRQRLQSPAAAY